MVEDFVDFLKRVALVVCVIGSLAGLPFFLERAYDVMTGQDDEPRVDEAYWAERGYEPINYYDANDERCCNEEEDDWARAF